MYILKTKLVPKPRLFRIVCTRVTHRIAEEALADASTDFENAKTKYSVAFAEDAEDVEDATKAVIKAKSDYEAIFKMHSIARSNGVASIADVGFNEIFDEEHLKREIKAGLQEYADGRFDQVIFNLKREIKAVLREFYLKRKIRFDKVIWDNDILYYSINIDELYYAVEDFLYIRPKDRNWLRRRSFATVLNSLKNVVTFTAMVRVFQCNDTVRIIGSFL